MTIQEFNEKVIAGGYDWDTPRIRLYQQMTLGWPNVPAEILLLDPEAWKAVGKVEGWGKCGTFAHDSRACRDNGWFRRMSEMVVHLAEGGTIESYLATL